MPTLEEILRDSQNSDDLITENTFKSNYIAENIAAVENKDAIPEFKTPRIQSTASNNIQNYTPVKITGESKKVRDVVIKSIEGQNGDIPNFNFYKVQGQNAEIPEFNAANIIGKEFDPNNLSTVDIAMVLSANSPKLIDTTLGLMVGGTGGVDPSKANVESTKYKQRTGIISALNTEWENFSNNLDSLKNDISNLGSASINALTGSATNAMKRITAVANNAIYRADSLINSVPSKITGLLNNLIFGNNILGVAELPVGGSMISLGISNVLSTANSTVNNLFTGIDNGINNILNSVNRVTGSAIEEYQYPSINPIRLLSESNILWHLSLASWDFEARKKLYKNSQSIEKSQYVTTLMGRSVNTTQIQNYSGSNKITLNKTAAGTLGINKDGNYYIGPALEGYSSIEGTHPRVDNFYDFKLVAPQINVNRGLPIPLRLREYPIVQRVEDHMNNVMLSRTGSEAEKVEAKKVISYLQGNKNLLLLSNMAEISTIEVSNGEQISLGDWGAASIVKRLDQIARITTVIYEDRQHSVRKWLEAYKYYMYGPQPNPNIHKPIFQCWYRLQYYLLNNDRSVAYSRGFRVLPNFNLNMTPSDDVKEFIINWDVIGEDLLIDNTAATTYNRNVLRIPWFQQLDREKSNDSTAKEVESDVLYGQMTYLG